MAERLIARFPGLNVVGTHSPPFRLLTAEEDAAEVAQINATRPDFVWVGLGSPKQDRWVIEHRARLTAAVVLAVGAAFDFHSGNLRRAPHWMQRTGTEWIFRLLAEPRRLARRYTVTNSRFAILLVRQILGWGRQPSRPLSAPNGPTGGQRPSARSIAGIVRSMIRMSSQVDQRSMYSRSF